MPILNDTFRATMSREIYIRVFLFHGTRARASVDFYSPTRAVKRQHRAYFMRERSSRHVVSVIDINFTFAWVLRAYCALRRPSRSPFLSLLFLSFFLLSSPSLAFSLGLQRWRRRSRPAGLCRWKCLSRSDASRLLFMSFIYSAETTKLNFPRFLGGQNARAE